jgi:hypothetical protein
MEMWKTLMKPAFPTFPQGLPRENKDMRTKAKNNTEAVYRPHPKGDAHARVDRSTRGGIFK